MPAPAGDETRAGRPVAWRTCRLCGGADLQTVLDLGTQHLQGAFVKAGSPTPPDGRYPLECVRCRSCGLLQLRHSAPRAVLYSTYWYRSRVNQTMRDHLHWIAVRSAQILGRPPRRVLDVGCNDGTLLLSYEDCERVGIEPSNAGEDAPPELTVIRDYFPTAEPTAHPALRPGSVDVVTAIAMFYDSDDPVDFAERVGELLAPDGIWVVEVAYLPDMLRNAGYDAICHEHLTYFCLSSLEAVFAKAGLALVAAERNPINGGSICCFVAREDSHVAARSRYAAQTEQLRAAEHRLGLTTDGPYEDFARRVYRHRGQLQTLLRRLRAENRTIHVYGASTKGNVLLQFCGIDGSIVDFAAERNPQKFGAVTLGTNIPIISEAESRALRPDYYLVLPWHFRDEILPREAQTLRQGSRFIFPLPELEIVEWSG
jgi:SAM-dependent methyltransferase